MRRRRRLSEAAHNWIDSTDYAVMTDIEQFWHKKITAILFNKKGKWGPYQHALYALRFQDYVLKIVPLSVDPEFTACVYFDRAVVYVGEGFLVDDSKCYQLNVIIRHELAHLLLRHQIRMVHKIGELPYSKIAMSSSIQGLINVIADFEISNRKYTSEDKHIVLNMYLNGELIKGLVTEMHREDWAKLPLEDMYDRLTEELDNITTELSEVGGDISELPYSSTVRKRLSQTDETGKPAPDTITYRGVSAARMYLDTNTPSIIWSPIDDYIKTSKQFTKMATHFQNIVKKAYEELKSANTAQLERLLERLICSKLIETVKVGADLEVTAPEEKFWLNQVLKTLLGNSRPKPTPVRVTRAEHSKEYKDAYNNIIRKCGRVKDCPTEEIEELLRKIKIGGDI